MKEHKYSIKLTAKEMFVIKRCLSDSLLGDSDMVLKGTNLRESDIESAHNSINEQYPLSVDFPIVGGQDGH